MSRKTKRKGQSAASLPEGVYERHESKCASRRGSDCDCRVRFQAKVYDKATKSTESKTFASRKEASRWRASKYAEYEARRRPPSAVTLAEFGDRVMDDAANGLILSRGQSARLDEGTVKRYRASWKKVVDELGEIRLSDLKRADIERFVRERRAAGDAPATTSNDLIALSLVMREAVSRDLIDHNLTSGIRRSRIPEHEYRAFSKDVLDEHLRVLDSENQTFALILADTGARISECVAIRWGDVDSRRGLLALRGPAKKTDKKRRTKTVAGQREVPMTPRLKKSLQKWRSQYRKEHGRPDPDDFVFPSPVRPGHSISVSGARERLAKAWEKAGLEWITPHEFRHSLATDIGAQDSVNARALADIMGHTDPAFTYKRYVHKSPKAMQREILRLERDEL